MKLILLTAVLLHASYVDIKTKEVNTITYILLFITGLIDLSRLSFLGLIITALPLAAVAILNGGIGGGDVKLAAMCGFCLGGIYGLCGTAIGTILAVIVIPIKHAVTKETKPYKPFAFVPFLSFGYLLMAVLTTI